jgi:hypothetical protein
VSKIRIKLTAAQMTALGTAGVLEDLDGDDEVLAAAVQGRYRKAVLDLLKQREWLVEQVCAEAKARGDHSSERVSRTLNPRNFPPPDADGCCRE